SVKTLFEIEKAIPGCPGHGYFSTTDGVSVFDFGWVADIKNKGSSLTLQSAKTFEMFEKKRIPTHYGGLPRKNEEARLNELKGPTNLMFITTVYVPKLKPRKVAGKLAYDYEQYHSDADGTAVMPIEIIPRNEIGPDSSLRKHHSPREVGLDTDTWPEGTVVLEKPYLDFSSKYEEEDRYVNEEEALQMSGVSESLFRKVKEYALKANDIITEHAKKLDLKNGDGKVEMMYLGDKIYLVDFAGTLDENRINCKVNGEWKKANKQLLRNWFKNYDKEWYEDVNRAKKEAVEKNESDWKKLLKVERKTVPQDFLYGLSKVYMSFTNRWTEKTFFPESGTLEENTAKIFENYNV
ncbi:MAG: hypothetical protein JSV92_04895, partial [archaeon]